VGSNEIRKDYLLNRWVVIAKDRGKRPTDFLTQETGKKENTCPFCAGNENMTPPAVLLYLKSNGKVRKEQNHNGFRSKDWLVRVIPNAYPAFAPPKNETESIKKNTVLTKAVGHHEVFVESPCHDEHPGVARLSQLKHVINAYLDRLTILSERTYVKHVAIFRNHGRKAGASLSHAHSQMITTPFIPQIPKEELEASKHYWTKNGECLLCNVLKKEAKGPRFIWDNNSFLVFAPWASVNPLEFWVLPKRHQSNMAYISQNEITDLAETMRVCLGGLRALLNDPPYNFGFHTLLSKDAKDSYHWHLEVYPQLTVWAGFENSTGVFINTIAPEDAASELRSATQKEKRALKQHS
jgi:UDPglucose--hexose-1-phosphate uridylyltransferase